MNSIVASNRAGLLDSDVEVHNDIRVRLLCWLTDEAERVRCPDDPMFPELRSQLGNAKPGSSTSHLSTTTSSTTAVIETSGTEHATRPAAEGDTAMPGVQPMPLSESKQERNTPAWNAWGLVLHSSPVKSSSNEVMAATRTSANGGSWRELIDSRYGIYPRHKSPSKANQLLIPK